MASEAKDFKVLGTRPIRHDGADKVTGRAIYGADFTVSGMVHAKTLRSPHAHAKIKSIDTSAAEKHPDVLAVATSADFANFEELTAELGEGSAVSLGHLAANVLARDKVLYKGHAVAAVAAKTANAAEEALKLLHVEYEPLPAVTWVLDAMKDEVLLHDDIYTDEMGKKGDKPSNISSHLHFEHGDVEKGFAEADIVIEREFKTASAHQGYIEPHVATALWNEDGHITVWTSTQGAFTVRDQVSSLLSVPVSRVTVVPCEIGGGFGGKITVYLAPVAAILSRKCGHPVKMVMNRSEVFEGTGPTPGSFVRVKLGATKEGKLTAGEAWLAYDAGAFPGGMIGPGCMCVFSCYDLPNARVDGYDVLDNKPKTQAYRAPGATQAAFACESVVDEIVEELGMDPIDFRLMNASREGTRRVDGPVYPRVGFVELLEAAKNSDHWKSKLEGPNRGRGIAAGFWFNCGLQSSVNAHVNADGTVSLAEGSTDIGGTRTSVAMQLAETLGIAAEEVHPRVVDTDSVGYTEVTGGSRTAFATGWAAHEAGLDISRQMCERAAILWECDAAEVKHDDGAFRNGTHSMTFKELAGKLKETGAPVSGQGTVNPLDPTNTFGLHIADVEIDPETGKATVLRYTALQDAGKAVHPSYVEGQLQGGAVQGIGWAFSEEYMFDDKGHMLNPTMLDYRMPTALDIPMIDTIIVEVPNSQHPFGVRGAGETPIVPPPATLANAVYHATGVRVRELPMSPPTVCKAILGKNGQ